MIFCCIFQPAFGCCAYYESRIKVCILTNLQVLAWYPHGIHVMSLQIIANIPSSYFNKSLFYLRQNLVSYTGLAFYCKLWTLDIPTLQYWRSRCVIMHYNLAAYSIFLNLHYQSMHTLKLNWPMLTVSTQLWEALYKDHGILTKQTLHKSIRPSPKNVLFIHFVHVEENPVLKPV